MRKFDLRDPIFRGSELISLKDSWRLRSSKGKRTHFALGFLEIGRVMILMYNVLVNRGGKLDSGNYENIWALY